MRTSLFFLAAFIFISACNSSTSVTEKPETAVAEPVTKPFPDSVKVALDSLVTGIARESKCRMTVKIANDSNGVYYSGYDGRADKVISDFSGTIDIGSCSKMFTAASILQLVEQGKLSLQDQLVKVLPGDTIYKNLLVIKGRNYIDSVKIINLLNHSSGFPEYFIEGDDDKEIKLHGDSSLRFTPYDLITMAKRVGKPQFVPGTSFKYTNLNYIFLGMIIEKISGQTYQQYIQEHILNPLELKHTFFASVNPPANRADGHFKGKIAVMPATIAGAAGEIISDLDDMQKFILAWGNGKLFSKAETIRTLKEDNYLDMAPGIITYGMGVLNILNMVQGHAGQTFGFQSFMGVLKNNDSFAFGIDDAAVSAFEPAISITGILNDNN